ncbi:hypothetical protein AAVH_35048 [Aphelenchoides avenae]|nr:hypothetical protein AAVH_35048 [Aphelenchus avenae]
MTFAGPFVHSVAAITAQRRLTYFLRVGSSPAGRKYSAVFATAADACIRKDAAATKERPLLIARWLGDPLAGCAESVVIEIVAAAFARKVAAVMAERTLHISPRPTNSLAGCAQRVVFVTVAGALITKVAGAAAEQGFLILRLWDLAVAGEKSSSAGFSLPVRFEHASDRHKLIVVKVGRLYTSTPQVVKTYALRA